MASSVTSCFLWFKLIITILLVGGLCGVIGYGVWRISENISGNPEVKIQEATDLALHHTRRFTELSLTGFNPGNTLKVRSALENVAITLTQEATYIGQTAAAGFPEFAQDFHNLMVSVRDAGNRYSELADKSYDVFLAERDAIEVAARYLEVLSSQIASGDFEEAAFSCDNLIRHLDIPLQETKELTEQAQELHQNLRHLNATANFLFSKTMNKMTALQKERWSSLQRTLTYLVFTPVGGAIKHIVDHKRDKKQDSALSNLAVAYHSMQVGLEEASRHVKSFKEDLLQMKHSISNSQHSFHILQGNAELASRALGDAKSQASLNSLMMLIEDARRRLLTTLSDITKRVSAPNRELPE